MENATNSPSIETIKTKIFGGNEWAICSIDGNQNPTFMQVKYIKAPDDKSHNLPECYHLPSKSDFESLETFQELYNFFEKGVTYWCYPNYIRPKNEYGKDIKLTIAWLSENEDKFEFKEISQIAENQIDEISLNSIQDSEETKQHYNLVLVRKVPKNSQ